MSPRAEQAGTSDSSWSSMAQHVYKCVPGGSSPSCGAQPTTREQLLPCLHWAPRKGMFLPTWALCKSLESLGELWKKRQWILTYCAEHLLLDWRMWTMWWRSHSTELPGKWGMQPPSHFSVQFFFQNTRKIKCRNEVQFLFLFLKLTTLQLFPVVG